MGINKFTEQAFIQEPERKDRPVKDKDPDALRKQLQSMKVGDEVVFPGGEGRIVGKQGEFLTVAASNGINRVAVKDTYSPNDIEAHIWNMLAAETRQSILFKANVPTNFAVRDWYDLPTTLRQVLKEKNYLKKSGFSGREPGISRDSESQNFRDAINPKHVNKPIDDKEKSDVEHNRLGGPISTDTPFDAPEDYEEDCRDGERAQHTHEHLPAKTKDGDGGDGGSLSTTTEGTNNPIYSDPKDSKRENKKKFYSSRYGMRYGVDEIKDNL